MKPLTKSSFTALVGLLLIGSACSESPTAPINTSLVGVWKLIGYEDGEQVPKPSGTWVFFDDGFMALDLHFEFVGRPPTRLAATGNFEQTEGGVTLEVRRSETSWALDFSDTLATFRQTAPSPADDKMVLRRF